MLLQGKGACRGDGVLNSTFIFCKILDFWRFPLRWGESQTLVTSDHSLDCFCKRERCCFHSMVKYCYGGCYSKYVTSYFLLMAAIIRYKRGNKEPYTDRHQSQENSKPTSLNPYLKAPVPSSIHRSSSFLQSILCISVDGSREHHGNSSMVTISMTTRSCKRNAFLFKMRAWFPWLLLLLMEIARDWLWHG